MKGMQSLKRMMQPQNNGAGEGEKGREGKIPDICLTGPRQAMPSC